jgi:hypothetical protein
LPETGKTIADNANRDGVAERCAEPAVHKTIAVDVALITSYAQLLGDWARSIVKAAPPQDAKTLSL